MTSPSSPAASHQPAVLVDTHVVIWLANNDKKGAKAQKLLQNADTVYLSSLSLLEINMKRVAGKLKMDAPIDTLIDDLKLTILDYTQKHTDAYRIFDVSNKDPFDNALIAIAHCENISFVTADRLITPLSVTYPWIVGV